MKRIVFSFLIIALLFSQSYAQPWDKCGTWRWNVKTLTDDSNMDWESMEPLETTVDKLIKEKAPKKLTTGSKTDKVLPRYPGEKRLVRIRAYVTEIKKEADHDFHFVLQSAETDNMMVGEIPHPECPDFDNFSEIKSMFVKAYKQGEDIRKALKASDNAVLVEIIGVPFWDAVHGQTGGAPNGMEIHPITSIKLVNEGDVIVAGTANANGENSIVDRNTPETSPPANSSNKTPSEVLIMIVLGAILGMVGQGVRVLVGLKKMGDEAALTNTSMSQLFKMQELLCSLLIAFSVGAIAGVLAAVSSYDMAFDKTTVFAFLAAGYAGTDFIEGFMKKNSKAIKG